MRVRVVPVPKQGGCRITESWLRSLTDSECMSRFRITTTNIFDLIDALDVPEIITTPSRYKFDAMEAFCLTLARFRSAGDQSDLCRMYHRSQSAISEVINFMMSLMSSMAQQIFELEVLQLKGCS
ncbi:hypothetical protein K435DRAFT_706026 [Dendrothele bispora CBS 962.96]|uniref:DDE Tnp4 domain-containing protein n=1 Tax=Dendrothele bispora (strain CBS 962.96) TaxID=1314807 RepID=A0A4S8KKA5_DENBC|nr:hypothetical protein K435DRAFT_706026 [Dendrothele bispora CBS 962.96]